MILENNNDEVFNYFKTILEKINIHDTNDTYYKYIYIYIYFAYNKWGRGDSNPCSLHGGDQALPLSHRALGTKHK